MKISYQKQCYACKGTGILDGKICRVCKGSKVVEDHSSATENHYFFNPKFQLQ